MPVKLEIKPADSAVGTQRKAVAERVLACFTSSLPPSRLLCFLDNVDLSGSRGERGRYMPIHDSTPLEGWEEYITDCIFVDDDVSFERVIDDLVYLHGSTCAVDIGLTMTLAHEIQHSVQHGGMRKLWAANSIINQLEQQAISKLKLTWADIPIEQEARIVSKRVAVELFGEERVTQHINEKIREHVSESDVADWQFIRSLTGSSSVNLVSGTVTLYQRMKGCGAELKDALERSQKFNREDFNDIDVDALLGGASPI